MNWHHPDLHFSLFMLAGLATFLVIIYECIQKFGRKRLVVEPIRGIVNEKVVDLPLPPKYVDPSSPFIPLCESIENLPAKEQASRVREYFGIFGGVRLVEGRGRKGGRS